MSTKFDPTTLLAVLLLVLPAAAANAEDGRAMTTKKDADATTTTRASQPKRLQKDGEDPYALPNETWISISGTVKGVTADSFMLDYGDGWITVEMDDGDRDADAYALLVGDKVTVNGRIDDDFYEATTIEASSVYVEKLGTYFYASAVDEEDFLYYSIATPIVVSSTVVKGKVTDVDDDEFTVDDGLRKLTVDVDELGYDPLDDEGYQKIRKGDVVRVTGTIDSGFFTGRRLIADSVIRLSS